MADQSAAETTQGQLHEPGAEALEAAQAQRAGAEFAWHYGRVTRLGHSTIAGGHSVTVIWEEGGVSSVQGTVEDGEWEILKLAFMTSGRIAVLSDRTGDGWMYDYRFLEAVR